MDYLKIDADAISQTISKMVEDEIKKTVRAQVKRFTPSQYEIKKVIDDMVFDQVHILLSDEVKKYKENVLKPKIVDDIQKMIDETNVLEESCLAVPDIVADRIKGFEEAVFQRVMKSKFKDPNECIIYEFHEIMAKYLTRVYEQSVADKM